MEYLQKKMFRDIKSNWTQFVSVFLMSMISVLIFSGMASVWTGLKVQVDSYVEKSNMADLWVKAMSVTDEDLRAIEEMMEVDTITRSMSVSLSVEGGESELQISTVDNTDVSRPVLIEGEEYDCISDEGIWIDRDYAEEHNLKAGDKISVESYENFNGNVELEIRGIVMSPEYIYYIGNITETVPNYEKYGYAFVGNETMQRLCPAINYTQVEMLTNGGVNDSGFEEIFKERYICTQDRDNYNSFARSTQEIKQMQKMAMLFSAVFILLALMTMYTSMVRLVKRQTTLIGTMKALGISSASIRLHYACYGVIIPVIGGIVGLIIGRYTVSKALMKVKQTTIYLPEWKLVHAKASFALILLIALCCIFAALLAAQKCLKGMPVEIMRGNTESREVKAKALENTFMNKFSYEWRWSLRNSWQNKVRFLMGIVGVMGGMTLMIAGLGVQDAIHGSNDYVFEKQFQYSTKAILSTAGITFETDEAYQLIQESNIEIRTDGQDIRQSVITVCEDGDMLVFYNDEDEAVSLPESGAVISRKLADDLNISAGDKIEIRVFGVQDWITVEIAATVKMLSPQAVFIAKEAYEDLGMTFAATACLSASEDVDRIAELPQVKSIITKKQQVENTDQVANSVMSIVKLLIFASVVLGIVILYNLGILNYVERVRDYATMKVLGFYQREIRSLSIRECILTTLLGWALGLPLGIKFLQLYVKIISFDSFEWISLVQTKTLVIASVVIVGVSILVNLLLSSKVKRIVMVEALKSVE